MPAMSIMLWLIHLILHINISVAHSDVFGYGFRTYEYLPPPSHDFVNSSIISDAHAHAIKHGMFSLRSFLLPKVLALVLTISDMCGSNTSPYLVSIVFLLIFRHFSYHFTKTDKYVY